MLFLSSLVFAADPAAVREIRQLYQAGKAAQAEQLVKHTARLNANDRSYAAVGTYGRSMVAWVRPDPVGETSVVLVEADTLTAAWRVDLEVLYHDGRPRFVLVEQLYDHPLRVYLDAKGEPVRLQVGEVAYDTLDAKQKAFVAKVAGWAGRLHDEAKRLDGFMEPGLDPEDVGPHLGEAE
ncbi:MAG: hypothetical protein KC656_00090 [Myxococcales bacterium]|nr:hypothetical protein [Myxococcales bacterium]MCB9669101.1 hypothetical protein [Alphaproteobacteria bacterium]